MCVTKRGSWPRPDGFQVPPSIDAGPGPMIGPDQFGHFPGVGPLPGGEQAFGPGLV